jgi:hypothetical protein
MIRDGLLYNLLSILVFLDGKIGGIGLQGTF